MSTTELENRDFYELEHFKLQKQIITKLPKKFCYENMVVILKDCDSSSNLFLVGMLHIEDTTILNKIKNLLHKKIKPIQLNEYEITKALDFAFSDQYRTEEYVLNINQTREIHFSKNQEAKDILDDLLSQAIKMNSTDIHIENYNDDIDLRFRIDGVLHQIVTPLNPKNIKQVIGRIKVMSELDLAERHMPQDGKLKIAYKNGETIRHLDIRISVLPSNYGENIVLRILDSEILISPYINLGLSDTNINRINQHCQLKNGIILFTGPTGSGKTTTLYSVINKINTSENKIISIEDPIEFDIPKISQYQVDFRLGFEVLAKAFLRHDPDVIIIGEIRDEESAKFALRASSTGHLVLSTMHTNDAISVIGRFRDLGVPDSFVAENLRLSVSQRLVRKSCKKCNGTGFLENHSTKAKCPNCFGIGYKGRTGLFETFSPDNKIKSMIADHKSLQEIRSQYKNEETLEFAARQKINASVTTKEEVMKVINLNSTKEEPYQLNSDALHRH